LQELSGDAEVLFHVTDFGQLRGVEGLYWALLVASVEEAVTASDGEVAGDTTMGSMIMVRVEVAVRPPAPLKGRELGQPGARTVPIQPRPR
jgi:hypothetical protein